jgi:hypothetical protein
MQQPLSITDPIPLDDESYAIVQNATQPLPPNMRGAFLRALTKQLQKHEREIGAIGAGVVARLAASLQKRYLSGSGHADAARERADAQFKRRAD